MGLRRPGLTKEYEEMPGANVPMPSKHTHLSHLHNQTHANSHSQRSAQAGDLSVCQDLEMSSVSVVPDGLYTHFALFCVSLWRCFTCRYIYGYTSGERTGFWVVSSETVPMCRIMLDGGFHGNDHIECAWTSSSLRLGHQSISASTHHNHCLLGHDDELHVLGTIE